MASWDEILKELGSVDSQIDQVRKKYLAELHEYTGRNTIIYYSGWLKWPQAQNLDINDQDMGGFMNAIRNLDYSKGLDLILHTPGGVPSATEAIVRYLMDKFQKDIRVIVPQLAQSAGTMMACAAKSIVMGKHSSLGPIDPQYQGIPAYNIVKEFEEAKYELAKSPANIHFWNIRLSQYPAAFMKTAIDAIELSEQLVKEWLKENMFFNELEDETTKRETGLKIGTIVKALIDREESKDHGRHFGYNYCKDLGLKIESLESDQQFQDKVLSVHHATTITIDNTNTAKIIENHLGRAFINSTGFQGVQNV